MVGPKVAHSRRLMVKVLMSAVVGEGSATQQKGGDGGRAKGVVEGGVAALQRRRYVICFDVCFHRLMIVWLS